MLRWYLPLTAIAVLASACSSAGATPPTATSAASPAPPVSGGATGKQWPAAPAIEIEQQKSYRATLKTTSGDVAIELLPKEAPIAVNNFVFLARQGYYDNVPIHRIVAGFVIQSGDPTGTGMGGPGYKIQDERVVLNYERGAVAMARTAEPNSAGSQFFICLSDISKQLEKKYMIFGRVASGMDVVDKIAQTPVKRGPGGEQSSPTTPVSIQSIAIEEN
jgi:cyclophilin family peptidyl-prolyl cis-trans isomerase